MTQNGLAWVLIFYLRTWLFQRLGLNFARTASNSGIFRSLQVWPHLWTANPGPVSTTLVPVSPSSRLPVPKQLTCRSSSSSSWATGPWVPRGTAGSAGRLISACSSHHRCWGSPRTAGSGTNKNHLHSQTTLPWFFVDHNICFSVVNLELIFFALKAVFLLNQSPSYPEHSQRYCPNPF